jgi:hypothetical protein
LLNILFDKNQSKYKRTLNFFIEIFGCIMPWVPTSLILKNWP